MIGTVWNYPYTGEEQIFVSPCKGIYRLETWGAQGGSYNSTYIGGLGGQNSSNISFGTGYDCGNSGVCDGGGGGFFGGKYGTSGAGGGSGYIGNPSLINKTMYCYGCTESNEEATKTEKTTCVDDVPIEKCSKKGNGYARITLLSLS